MPDARLHAKENDFDMTSEGRPGDGLRRVVRLVAVLNLAYFGVEFAVAVAIGSVSLFADSAATP
jgi:Co/Zn/Cd efflux system component